MIGPNWHPTRPQLRQFAVAALLASAIVGTALRWRFGSDLAPLLIWSFGSVVFVLGMLSPTLVRPVYRVLMAITLPIGWAVSNVFLRVIYYGLFTPIGLVLRLVGRDPLRMKKPNTSSYYLERKQPRDLSSYYRQA